MRWTPHVTVACVVEDQGRFLLVEEYSNNNRVLNQPAGHLEANETLVAAATREVLEESAWQVEVTDLIGLYTYTSPHNNTCYHRHCFVAKPIKHFTDRPLDPVILDTHWLSIEQIRQQQDKLRSPMVLKVIEDYLAGVRHPLTVICEESELAPA